MSAMECIQSFPSQVLFRRVFIINFSFVFGSRNFRLHNSLKLSRKISSHDGMGNSVVRVRMPCCLPNH